ncbi:MULTISPECIES: CPBP family intramembrane glutamic endopeptidase [Haloferacaceae]|uniref:CPBP family intramembrane glutamic endopeptidase n=1 Tax=Halorubrum glutamatedens TaxID=2707018 RepID=A0ABD5QWK4_9EURY|nr:type II CAAX endopeptidase family protein [Halobellus captivus]
MIGFEQSTTEAHRPRLGSPWVYFAATYAITWGFWVSAIALDVSFDTAIGTVLLLVGLAGPAVAGIALVYLVYGERGRVDFWNRVKQVRRVGVRWFLVILAVPVGVTIVAAIADILLGGPGVEFGEAVTGFPLPTLPTLFISTLPPLLEELGWRGYALDRLQMDWSALNASLLLGVVWAAWHLPLFFIRGSFHYEVVGFLTVGFWLFNIGVVALSVIFTWVYNHTARSIIGIILLHGWVGRVKLENEAFDFGHRHSEVERLIL